MAAVLKTILQETKPGDWAAAMQLAQRFSRDISTNFRKIYLQKRGNILFFLYQKQRFNSALGNASLTHFAIELHIVFNARGYRK